MMWIVVWFLLQWSDIRLWFCASSKVRVQAVTGLAYFTREINDL
jgi:hypothetical protein